MTAIQDSPAQPAAKLKRKNKNDSYVPVKADPPEIRGTLGSRKNKGGIREILDRLGPDALEFSRDAPPGLAAARVRLSDMIEKCDPDMPFAHNVVVDYWLGRALAERIRGQDLENRVVTNAQIETVVADILRPGAWKPNGDTIRFTPNGQVIDGQGRIIALLMACRKDPNASFVTDFRFNVPPEAFTTIDTGRKRTSKDVLDMAQVPNGYLMSAIARLWHGYHVGRIKTLPKITNAQVMEIVEANRELFITATHLTAQTRTETKIPGSVLGFCCALALRPYGRNETEQKINREKAKLFFRQLTTGAELKETDPAYVLRRAVKNKAKLNPRKGADRISAAALTIKALNAHFQGNDVDIVKWLPGEAFPRFIGDIGRTLRDDTPFAEQGGEDVESTETVEAEMADA